MSPRLESISMRLRIFSVIVLWCLMWNVSAQVVEIIDSNVERAIRSALRSELGKPSGDITPDELGSLTTLYLNNNDLTSLTLPEGLTNLTHLYLHNNDLTSLTLPEGLTRLTTLDLSYNNLTSLTLSEGLTNLTTLKFGGDGFSRMTSLTIPEGVNVDTFPGFDRQIVTFYRPVLRIKDIDILASGEFELTITGPQSSFAVESSSNLERWTEQGQLTIDEWKSTIRIPVQPEINHQFFRIRELMN